MHNENYTPDGFTTSVVAEIEEYSSNNIMSELTALVSMSGNRLAELLNCVANKLCNIRLSEKTVIGLYNEWNGSASMFDIELEEPAVFTPDMISNIQIEEAGKEYNDGYTVDTTCGFVGTVWKPHMLDLTKEKPCLCEENASDAYKAYSNL